MNVSYPQLLVATVCVSAAVSLGVYTLLPSWWSDNPSSNQSSGVDVDAFQKTLVQTVEEAQKSVVSIVVTRDLVFYRTPFFWFPWQEDPNLRTQKTQVGWWSGIFVHKDGYILTNKHVVQNPDAQYTVIFADGRMATGETIWVDPVLDIAILKVESMPQGTTAKPARIISLQDEVSIGQFAIAIWNALAEYQNTVTLGIISGRNRNLGMESENLYAGLYQTDTSINRWNSGGPLLDTKGNVIGINTAISAEWSNISFSIPVTQEFVDATLKSIAEYDSVVRPFIGIQYVDLTVSQAQQLGIPNTEGVYVVDVVPGSAADAAWIKKWDIISALQGKVINDEYPFLYQLYTFVPWDEVAFTVLRDNMPRNTIVLLGHNER